MKINGMYIDYVEVPGTLVKQWALMNDGRFDMYREMGTTEKVSVTKYRYSTADQKQSGYAGTRQEALTILLRYALLSPDEKRQVLQEVSLADMKAAQVRREVEPHNFKEMR